MPITKVLGKIFSKEKQKEEAKSEEKKGSEKKPKYAEQTCALCGGLGCDKKWAGQYWHKKCLRAMRKTAKGML